MPLSVERMGNTRPAIAPRQRPRARFQVLRAFFFALGCLLAGAFLGAVIGTPAIRNLTEAPALGPNTGIAAGVCAVLFLIGGFLLRAGRELPPETAGRRAGPILGSLILGAIAGGFIGSLFPALGKGLGAELGALLFVLAAVAPPRRGPAIGRRNDASWTFSSLLLTAITCAGISVFFPLVRDTYVLAIARGLLLVTAPCAAIGAIAGVLFAPHTGRRRGLTTAIAIASAVAALAALGLYHAPLRQISFPADNAAGTIRYARWLDYVTVEARGTMRVPLRGDVCLQLGGTGPADLAFLHGVSGLRELDLVGAQITDDALRHLARCTELTWLALDDTPVSDEGLRHLSGLTALEWLGLNRTRITDAGLAHLRELRALKHLGLAETAVTDAGLESLAKLTNLESLDLFGVAVSDAGIPYLARLSRLKDLDLYETSVSAGKIAWLREYLPACDIGFLAPPSVAAPSAEPAVQEMLEAPAESAAPGAK